MFPATIFTVLCILLCACIFSSINCSIQATADTTHTSRPVDVHLHRGVGLDGREDRSGDVAVADGSAVALDKLTSRQRRHLKREILAVLGLDRTPQPAARAAERRALTDYMLALYRSTADSEAGEMFTDAWNGLYHTRSSDDNGTALVEAQLDGVDTIVSFTNQGNSR